MASTGLLKRIKNILRLIYSKPESDFIFPALKNLMDAYRGNEEILARRKKYNDCVVLDESDSILMTYADSIYGQGEKPLFTLYEFLKRHVKNATSSVHILPFFPSSSDAGYSVIDYKKVDPVLGTWDDLRRISNKYRLMVDLVLNHVSSRSKWFLGFLEGEKHYRDFFIWSDQRVEMPEVFRPRETPLFTRFHTASGEKYVWTTFGPDQIDLNYRNPEVLLKIIDVFLYYLSQGAEIIRLDAIGYVWKEPHTSCVNLSKTHQIVRLLRSIMEYVAPYALILTEANFPYKENIAYFGESHEANMVYRFSLPPLVADAFARRDTTYIKKITNRKRGDLLFFDFLASHDGIALPAAKEILNKVEFDNLLRIAKDHGGLVSYKSSNGDKEPYELNISYFDIINDPRIPDDTQAVKRFMAAQAIMLSLKGVPGIYVHSLLGSRNYCKGVTESGLNRMINREKLQADELDAAISDPQSIRSQVLNHFLHLLNVRKQIVSFHPAGTREVVDSDKRLLIIRRNFQDKTIHVIINVSDDEVMAPDHKGKFDRLTRTAFDGSVNGYGIYFLE
ncbi:MAG TPA: sugar phosphorylase [Syntrophales bacterium]|nr:sugar phosphorylase [Syntrophales bacterium]